MTRILHVLDHSLPLHSGYTFRTRAIMKAQLASGLEVRAVTGQRHAASGGSDSVPAEEVDGLDFYRTKGNVGGPTPIGEMREVSALAGRIVRLHEEWPFDIVHAHSPVLNGLAGLRAARRLGLPFLYEIRAFWEDAAVGNGTGSEGSARYRLIRGLESHVVRSADAVAVICNGLRDDLIARGTSPSKILVSPNGVDMELFGMPPERDNALARELEIDGHDVLGFIGSFYDYEGLDLLIDAMPDIACKREATGAKPPMLLLVGGGPREEALSAQVAASSARDLVRFVGRVPHDQVERYYSLIDVLVYPRKPMRLTELVTPLKPLEAMAQRRLVVASDVGGHRELIDHGLTGQLFRAGDADSLTDAVCALLDDRESWDDRRAVARHYVERERSWQRNVERYRPVYQSLLGTGSESQAA